MGSSSWPSTPAGSGPSWQQVEAAGGSPAPGTPAHQQQQRLAVLAAVEWLPTVTRFPVWSGRRLVGLTAMDYDCMARFPGGLGVTWTWLRLAARQALAHVGPSSAQQAWGQLLVRDLAAVAHVGHVLRNACRVGGRRDGWDTVQAEVEEAERLTEEEEAAVVAALCEVLPAALDVLEVLVLVQTQGVLEGLRENQDARRAWAVERRRKEAARKVGGRGPTLEGQGPNKKKQQQQKEEAPPGGWGPGLPWDEHVREVIVKQGRGELVGLVEGLLGPGKGRALGEDGVAVRLREHALSRLGAELPVLPGPVVDVGFPRCGYAGCLSVKGESEAGVRLQACGRCGAVGYCSVKCQKADMVAHRAACKRGVGANG